MNEAMRSWLARPGFLLLVALVFFSSAWAVADMVHPGMDKKIKVAVRGSSESGESSRWAQLAKDRLHDPGNPSLVELQEPGEAFAGFPKDNLHIGNQVDWVRALEQGVIVPRTNLFPDTHIEVLDLDIIMEQTSTMPYVRFPHRAHTQWLACSNCHDHLFVEKAGANPVNMFAILSGEYCGRCHGAVAFPLTECRRCHSVSKKTFTGNPGAQPAPGRVYPPVTEQEVVH